MAFPVVLAHQANWDEILLVCVPLAIFWALLVRARHRADAIEAGELDPAELGIDDTSFGPKNPRITEAIGPGSATGPGSLISPGSAADEP